MHTQAIKGRGELVQSSRSLVGRIFIHSQLSAGRPHNSEKELYVEDTRHLQVLVVEAGEAYLTLDVSWAK